jgi:hypothetical protein
MAFRIDRAQQRVVAAAVGLVLALALFVLHHAALLVERGLRRSRRAGGPCGRTPSTARCRARWSARSRSSWCGPGWWCRSGR